jgi:gliding motility associated protien GldN
MIKRILIAAVVVLAFLVQPASAQVLTPDDDGIIPDPPKFHHHNRVISYPFLRQADMMWSTRHWERIDLREKINQHLYYPIKAIPDRKSMFDVLVDGILQEGTIVEIFKDDRFTIPLTSEGLEELVNKYDTIPLDEDLGAVPTDPSTYFVDTIKVRANNVIAYLIKSDWYFDKQRGEMKNRIIALAPFVQDPQNKKNKYPLFWVWFPDARIALHTHTVYNRNNQIQRLTFDEVFHLRIFNSVVYKEDNVYDRAIADYKRSDALSQLLEAQMIRENLRNFEHDLWEF